VLFITFGLDWLRTFCEPGRATAETRVYALCSIIQDCCAMRTGMLCHLLRLRSLWRKEGNLGQGWFTNRL